LDSPDAELSVVIVGDDEIAGLNQTYLNRQGPTNVIAFAMREGAYADISPQLLGDVVISIETAYREGQEAGIDPLKRFDQLLVHGILHLFGYDHKTDESDAAKMEEKSEELLKLIAP
jgi:probable rRNA maturation factor